MAKGVLGIFIFFIYKNKPVIPPVASRLTPICVCEAAVGKRRANAGPGAIIDVPKREAVAFKIEFQLKF